MPTDREPFNPTDDQIDEAARRQALLDVFGRGQGKPEEEEPDEEGRRNAQEARGDHAAGRLMDSACHRVDRPRDVPGPFSGVES